MYVYVCKDQLLCFVSHKMMVISVYEQISLCYVPFGLPQDRSSLRGKIIAFSRFERNLRIY